jgi:MOSC domain-containing protein YiiM
MQVVSVNVSLARLVTWRGHEVRTGIFKEPVTGRVMVHRTNVDGDRQADLSVHGGEFKAVYAYSADHYSWWARELGRELSFGMFGENLTITGFDENEVGIGDRFAIGSAVLEAVQPRLPCYKLGIRFDDPQMTKRFMKSGRCGVYFRVVEEGDVGAGDSVVCTHQEPVRVPVPALAAWVDAATPDVDLARRALSVAALLPEWREFASEIAAQPVVT